MNEQGSRLLSLKETSVILGISPRSIYNKVHSKSKQSFPIQPKRIGRLIKFKREDVEAYIDSL